MMHANSVKVLHHIVGQLEKMKEREEERLDALGEKESERAKEQYSILEDQLGMLDEVISSIQELISQAQPGP